MLLGSGGESAMLLDTGVLPMLEWCAAKWGFQRKVRISLQSINPCYFQLHFTDAYILDRDRERFGSSERDAVIGEVHCVGTEHQLLDCSHASIGFHFCGTLSTTTTPDIIISCYGRHIIFKL